MPAFIGLEERSFTRGEVICLEPGIIGLAADSLSGYLDVDPKGVVFSEHAEGSPSLMRLPHLKYSCVPESVFRTKDADAAWLRNEILAWAEHIGATSLVWRTEPTDAKFMYEDYWDKYRPFAAIAIAALVKAKR